MSQKTGKIEKDVKASAASRLLVICVDRDDDVGEKTGIQTPVDRKSTRLNSSHSQQSRMPSSA